MPFLNFILTPYPELKEHFIICLTICSMIPLLLENFANMGFLYKFDRNCRVFAAKVVSLFGFIIITIAVPLDCKEPIFFFIMMFLAFVMNCSFSTIT
ncbi:hypothetical protein HZS_1921 [Henneguya salminicola]|nr:hypothetical protein HZS_1921 [Henneguya salminicola]